MTGGAPGACPQCAEPLRAGAERCPGCGLSLRPRPSLARAALLVALGFAVALGLLFGGLAAGEALRGPPWSGFPVAGPLFDPTVTVPAVPSPYARAGERWTFREAEGRVEVTWRVVEARGNQVRYLSSRTDEPGAAGPPATWTFTPLAQPVEVLAVGRETIDVGGRKIECLVVDAQDMKSMMNDMKRRLWVAVSGDTPVFPGLVRCEASNQGSTWVEWEAADVAADDAPVASPGAPSAPPAPRGG